MRRSFLPFALRLFLHLPLLSMMLAVEAFSQLPLSSTPLYSDPNLIAYYSLNGNSQSAIGDFNGTDNDVIYVNGKFGLAAQFDGMSDLLP